MRDTLGGRWVGYEQAICRSRIPKANMLMRGCSNSSVIREMEMETRREHFAPIRLEIMRRLVSVKCGQGHTDMAMFRCHSGECGASSSEGGSDIISSN